ncbi:MAG: prepilin-type N-terminal cleavage/methylation domain-containing protein [Planctomycetes bacterium]|nr:prepilin-type N-terminal cleavage/methylation domain-containing protein [Planctomycetota bacterium]
MVLIRNRPGRRSASCRRAWRPAGFTLMEVLAAMTIGTLIVMSAVGATRALTTTREKVDRRVERAAEARRALEAITGALRNVRRDASDPDKPVVVGYGDDGSGGGRINLLVIGDRRVRRDGSESDHYETSFFLSPSGGGRMLSSLMCRRDHALDDRIEEGGIVTTVADNIVGLSFEYRSAGQWYREWSPTELQPPEAVRVTVAAANRPDRDSRSMDTIVLSTVVAIHAAPRQAGSSQNEQQGKPAEGGPGP